MLIRNVSIPKAIFLKNLAKAKQEDDDKVDERTILLELPAGELLEKSDIDAAMDDIAPVSLYSSANSGEGIPFAQLYFGPGFEDRLELELDYLTRFAKETTDISLEEAKIREEEDKLFANIADPPSTKNAVMQLLGNKDKDKDETET